MRTFFSDIFYPSDAGKLTALTRFERKDETYPIIIVPHAGLSFVSEGLKAGFSHLRQAERYVFIAPLHNGAFPDSDSTLFTLSDTLFPTPYGKVAFRGISGLRAEDSILEEEYSAELTAPFFAQMENPAVLPIFTALSGAEDVKKLRRRISALRDGKTSFVISGNFAEEGKTEKMKKQADTLQQYLTEARPLLEEQRKQKVSGCALKTAEAFRGLYNSYIPLWEGSNPIHRSGAFV